MIRPTCKYSCAVAAASCIGANHEIASSDGLLNSAWDLIMPCRLREFGLHLLIVASLSSPFLPLYSFPLAFLSSSSSFTCSVHVCYTFRTSLRCWQVVKFALEAWSCDLPPAVVHTLWKCATFAA